MKKTSSFLKVFTAALLAFLLAGCNQSDSGLQLAEGESADREYLLKAMMTGYYGIGGEFDGVKNPVLTARKGEIVRITIVNGEVMPHDIALREHGAKSGQIIRVDERTSVTFRAERDDTYYCTIPGHVQTGMIGDFRLIGDPIDVAQSTE